MVVFGRADAFYGEGHGEKVIVRSVRLQVLLTSNGYEPGWDEQGIELVRVIV
jgi:hypothetical protein